MYIICIYIYTWWCTDIFESYALCLEPNFSCISSICIICTIYMYIYIYILCTPSRLYPGPRSGRYEVKLEETFRSFGVQTLRWARCEWSGRIPWRPLALVSLVVEIGNGGRFSPSGLSGARFGLSSFPNEGPSSMSKFVMATQCVQLLYTSFRKHHGHPQKVWTSFQFWPAETDIGVTQDKPSKQDTRFYFCCLGESLEGTKTCEVDQNCSRLLCRTPSQPGTKFGSTCPTNMVFRCSYCMNFYFFHLRVKTKRHQCFLFAGTTRQTNHLQSAI